MPWLELASFGVAFEAVQLVATSRGGDLMQQQAKLGVSGAFVVHIADYLYVEEVVKTSVVTVEKAV